MRLRKNRDGGKRTNWLLIKRHDGYKKEDTDVLNQDRSVASGRSMEQIEAGKGNHPKPFMLGKADTFRADAVWHSNKDDAKAKPAVAKARPKAKRKAAKGNAKMPSFIPPQLCKSVSRPPSGQDWVHEIKLDGYRMQMRVEDGEGVMRTRKGLDWTPKFAAVAKAASELPDCIKWLVEKLDDGRQLEEFVIT